MKETASRPPVAPPGQTYLCCRQSRRSQRTLWGKWTPSWGSSAGDPPSLLYQKGKQTAGSTKGTSEGRLRWFRWNPLDLQGFRRFWVVPSAPAPTCCTVGVSSQRPSLSVIAPQKGAPERRGLEERISSTRCVSSVLICHPLNLYCSSTGSISHIARTSASNGSRRRRTRDFTAETEET